MGKQTGKTGKKGNADFKKQKVKLGRKLPPAQNATSTAFKSKALQILSQSVCEDKPEAVSRRRLTLTDTLSQLRHHSANVRKDAASGLREILEKYPQELTAHLGSVFLSVLHCIVDPDPQVRHINRLVIRHIFTTVPAPALAPTVPLIVAHLCTALTHIDAPIRTDAIPVLDACLTNHPTLFTPYAHKLGPVLVHQLSTAPNDAARAPSGSSSSSKQGGKLATTKTRLVALRGARHLFSEILAATPAPNSTQASATPVVLQWSEADHHSLELWPGWRSSSNLGSGQGSFNQAACTQQWLVPAVQALLPALLHIWIESLPADGEITGFDNDADLASIQLELLHVLKLILRHLLGDPWSLNTTTSNTTTNTTIVLTAAGASVPHNRLARPKQVESPLQTLFSDKYCKELSRHLMLHFPFASSLSCKDTLLDGSPTDQELSRQRREKARTSATASNGRPETSTLGRVEDLLPDVLEVVVVLLRSAHLLAPDVVESLWKGVMSCYQACHPLSAAKRHCVSFLSRLLSEEFSSSGPMDSNRGGAFAAPDWLIEAALSSFPKLLCQLHGKDLQTSKLVLDTLLNTARRQRSPAALQDLHAAILPVFEMTINHGSQHQRTVVGPFVRFPQALQQQLIDLLYHLPPIPLTSAPPLARCLVYLASRPTEGVANPLSTISRLTDVLLIKLLAHSEPAPGPPSSDSDPSSDPSRTAGTAPPPPQSPSATDVHPFLVSFLTALPAATAPSDPAFAPESAPAPDSAPRTPTPAPTTTTEATALPVLAQALARPLRSYLESLVARHDLDEHSQPEAEGDVAMDSGGNSNLESHRRRLGPQQAVQALISAGCHPALLAGVV